MHPKRKSFGKKFKTLSKKSHSTLTFGEKTSDLSATDAINTLLSREDEHNNNESFEDIIEAFSHKISHKQKQIKQDQILHQKQKNDLKYHENKLKQQRANIEHLTKEIHPSQIQKKPKIIKPLRTLNDSSDNENTNNNPLDSSSNHKNEKSQKRSLPIVNNKPKIKSFTPPKKKQKIIEPKEQKQNNNSEVINESEIKDNYLLHWTTRYSDRDEEILPILRQRRMEVMRSMDISMDNYICFMDRHCDNIPITTTMNNKIFKYNSKIINNYNKLEHNNNKLNNLLMSCISSYKDLLFCDGNHMNDKEIKKVLTIHILSHILRNEEIRRANDIKIRENEYIECDINDNIIRDSGFKRLSVLIVTPFKENVRKFVENILKYLPNERKIRNARYQKFMDEYASLMDDKLKGRGKEFEELFSGNINDDFWCGIGIDKKGINFLQNWYYSDIIFISPLRLKLIFEKGKTSDGTSVFDFFSSIEIMILDQLHVIEMQNIKHLFDTLHKINWHPKLKKEQHIRNVNFNRLRYCYIDDVSQFYRQNIFITKHQTPKIKQLFQQRSMNIFGKIKIENKLNLNGILEKIIPFVRQEFIRFENTNTNTNKKKTDINELRLEIYKKYMFPIFKRNSGVKTLIFVSSYYDFLRLRNLYKNVENIKFLSEYTIKKHELKYRRGFGDESNINIMYLVITERYYFFKRLRCKGAKRVLFYSLPQNKEYYYQILNWFDTKNEYESYALYCKMYDNLSLQRIVGLKRMIKMLKNNNQKQVFV